MLASTEELSTDEGSSTDEDVSDIEEMGKKIEKLMKGKKNALQISHEREEQERQDLRRMLMEGERDEKKKIKKENSSNSNKENASTGANAEEDGPSIGNMGICKGKMLKITRTFRDANGKEFTRVESVKHPTIIEAYIHIRTHKDNEFINQFTSLDEQQKEEIKREKRRIQDQLRRIKRNQV